MEVSRPPIHDQMYELAALLYMGQPIDITTPESLASHFNSMDIGFDGFWWSAESMSRSLSLAVHAGLLESSGGTISVTVRGDDFVTDTVGAASRLVDGCRSVCSRLKVGLAAKLYPHESGTLHASVVVDSATFEAARDLRRDKKIK
jgi:hypothetical protein